VICPQLSFLANKAFLNKRKSVAGGKIHTTSMLWKVPKGKGVGYFLGSLTHWLAVLKSTVMKGNKIKVEHGVALLPLPVVGKIPFLLNQ